jgi:hypothetical protein
MSEIVNINNGLFEFDLHLLNQGGIADCCIPISKGMVKYMELEDTLANVGMSARVQLTNFYGFLQKFKILDISTNANSFSISIKNKDYDKFPFDLSNEIQLLTTINKNTELSKNIFDRDFVFDSEEYIVHALKTQKFNLALSKALKRDPSAVGYATTLTKLIEGCIAVSDNGAGTDRILKINHLDIPVVPGNITVDSDTLYDVIVKSYPYVYYENGGPGLLSVVNDKVNNIVTRKFTLQSLGSLTAGLYQKINSGSSDLSDFLLEKFCTTNSLNSTTLGSNFITDYNIIRQDQTDLLKDKWGDYQIKGFDTGTSVTDKLTYDDLVTEFKKVILGNNAYSNLPKLGDDRALFNVKDNINDSVQTKNKVKHTLLKSFIYDNTALSFKCKGQLYRTPGTFIEIRTEDSTTDTDNLNGYWFIISVRHIFEGDTYNNELICVKFNVNGKYTPVSEFKIQPLPQTTPSPIPIPQRTFQEEFDLPALPDLPADIENEESVLPPKPETEQELPDIPPTTYT